MPVRGLLGGGGWVRSFPRKRKKVMLDMWKRHIILMREHESFTPKHHLMFHCCLRSIWLGNPWTYHTFLDESLNKQLKAVCRLCHQSTFESTAMIKLNKVLSSFKRRLE